MSKNWKFEKSGDYYKDLAMRESSNRVEVKNKQGFMGLYQMGKGALKDAKYIDMKTGEWLGKNGINSEADFLKNREAQDIAVKEYHKIVWEGKGYLKDYQKYEGQEIGGVKLTKAGMISAAHLVGAGGLREFIDSKGITNDNDANGVTCKEYLSGFSNYTQNNEPKEYNVDLSFSQDHIDTAVKNTGSDISKLSSDKISKPQATPQPALQTQEQVAPTAQPALAQSTPAPQQNTEAAAPAPDANSHTVQAGDNLSTIAQGKGMSVEQLLAVPGNEQFKANPDAIKPGDKVQVTQPAPAPEAAAPAPAPEAAAPAPAPEAAAPAPAPEAAAPAPDANSHTVQAGDNLSTIAQGKGMSVEQLLAIPGNEQFKADPNKINPGDKVQIVQPAPAPEAAAPAPAPEAAAPAPAPEAAAPAPAPEAAAPAPAPEAAAPAPAPEAAAPAPDANSHTVQAGDNLSTIAAANNTSVEGLAAANNIADPNHIEVGQQINLGSAPPASNVPDISAAAMPTGIGGESHTIQSGETLSGIAAEHGMSVGDLASSNNISNVDHINAGDSISLSGGASSMGF